MRWITVIVLKNRYHPEHWRHAVEEGSQDYQHQAFGAFHESDAAGADQAFGSGPG